jgi:hypothetical protein
MWTIPWAQPVQEHLEDEAEQDSSRCFAVPASWAHDWALVGLIFQQKPSRALKKRSMMVDATAAG